MSLNDRRQSRRASHWQSRRRYGRVHLDVDWVLDTENTSTWGKGLDVSPRSARLPLTRLVDPFVTLQIALPGRARLFKARGHLLPKATGKGLVIRFDEVSPEDLALLGECLLTVAGLKAIPQLGLKFPRFTDLDQRFLRT